MDRPPEASAVDVSVRLTRGLGKTATLAAILVAALGVMVLAAWFLELDLVRRVLPEAVSMKANTALGFALAGLGLLAARRGRDWQRRAAGSAVALIGCATLLEYATGWDVGIDELLVRDVAVPVATPHPGRMSLLTAVCFMLSGGALVSLERRADRPLAAMLSIASAAIALLPFTAYFFGIRAPSFGIQRSTAMAVHTSVGFLFLALGLLAAHPERWPLGRFVLTSPASRLLRGIWPAVIGVPFALGLLRQLGERVGFFESAYGTALLVFSSTLTLGTLAFVVGGVAMTEERARSAAEKSLAASEKRYRQIVENTREGIAVVDGEGRYTFLNARLAEMFGTDVAALMGTRAAERVPEELRERTAFHFASSLRDEVGSYEVPLLRVDGARFIARISANRMRDERGDPSGWLALVSDVSEEHRIAELREQAASLEQHSRRAEEASRLKSEFLANMSHELRTPLNAIIGFADLLRSGRVGALPESHAEYMTDILTSARHLLALINDVLDLSRVEAGQLTLNPERVDVREVIQGTLTVVRELAVEKRIRVRTEVDDSLGPITIDPQRLKQVLYNYLSNALKFTQDGGSVVVRVSAAGPARFRIEVEDTGSGIAASDLPRLFREFSQLESGMAKRHQGTGLGLALTKRIVAALGGEVGVQSTPGLGSTFFAELPRETRRSAPVLAIPEPLLATRPGAPRVLVVEDEAAERAFLVRTLATAGFAVEAVGRGEAALERIRARRYDAITLDEILPDLSGTDVARVLREEPGPNRHTPFVFVTIVRDDKLMVALAASEVLHKPVAPAELIAALERAGLSPGAPREVLVIDDDPRALDVAREALDTLGFAARTAASAEEGLTAIQERAPDAILLDLVMPSLDGFAFLDRLRTLERELGARPVPVLVWTAKDLTASDVTRLASQAQGMISKGPDLAVGLVEELRRRLGEPKHEARP